MFFYSGSLDITGFTEFRNRLIYKIKKETIEVYAFIGILQLISFGKQTICPFYSIVRDLSQPLNSKKINFVSLHKYVYKLLNSLTNKEK